MADESQFKNLRLYDKQQFIVTTVANRLFEGNESMAIRHMIDDYGKRNLVAEPRPTTMVDVPAEYVTK